MRRGLLLLLVGFVAFVAMSTQAQQPDPGRVDTVELALTVGPDFNAGQMQVQVYHIICSKEYVKRSTIYTNC